MTAAAVRRLQPRTLLPTAQERRRAAAAAVQLKPSHTPPPVPPMNSSAAAAVQPAADAKPAADPRFRPADMVVGAKFLFQPARKAPVVYVLTAVWQRWQRRQQPSAAVRSLQEDRVELTSEQGDDVRTLTAWHVRNNVQWALVR